MGLLSGITNVIAKSPVGDAVHEVKEKAEDVKHAAVDAAKDGAKLVSEASKRVRTAAKDPVGSAVSAVKKAGEVATSAAERVEKAGRGAVEGARKGAKALGEKIERDGIGKTLVEGAQVVGKAAWQHKAEIGMWVGTAALLAAIPVTGGASGAVAGGLMATRAGMLAAKVPGAVRAAQAGAKMVSGTRKAADAIRPLRAAGDALHKGRLAVGATRAGKAAERAVNPLANVATALGAVNVADQTVKLARGDEGGSWKSLGLGVLGLVPGAMQARRGLASVKAARVEKAAARTVRKELPEVREKAAEALRTTDRIANRAPAKLEPVKADASRAVAVAARAEQKAVERLRVAGRRNDSGAEIAEIKQSVDQVVRAARVGKEQAARAVPVAPTSANTVTRKLEAAETKASRVSEKLERQLHKREELAEVMDTATKIEGKALNASAGANIVNNTSAVADDVHQDGAATGLTRGLANAVLKRNHNLRTPAA